MDLAMLAEMDCPSDIVQAPPLLCDIVPCFPHSCVFFAHGLIEINSSEAAAVQKEKAHAGACAVYCTEEGPWRTLNILCTVDAVDLEAQTEDAVSIAR